jgi:hypothetical protein
MEIINFFDCKDHYEARKKEQEYFILLNATLNSIEPMPKPKVISPIENKVKNNLELPEGKSKFYCSNCNYTTCRKSQYERHINTVKHIEITKRLQFELNEQNGFTCICGNKYSHRQNLHRHKKKCLFINGSVDNNKENEQQEETPINNTTTIFELLKQNNEFKELIIEQNKKFFELMSSINNTTNETMTK